VVKKQLAGAINGVRQENIKNTVKAIPAAKNNFFILGCFFIEGLT
jgi:hypothetical protein